MDAARSFLKRTWAAWDRRRRQAAVRKLWDFSQLSIDLRAEVAEAESLGLLDPLLVAELDRVQDDFVHMIQAAVDDFVPLSEALGVSVAESVFGDRLYQNGLDKQLAVGASAVGEATIEEAVVTLSECLAMKVCHAFKDLTPARLPDRSGAV